MLFFKWIGIIVLFWETYCHINTITFFCMEFIYFVHNNRYIKCLHKKYKTFLIVYSSSVLALFSFTISVIFWVPFLDTFLVRMGYILSHTITALFCEGQVWGSFYFIKYCHSFRKRLMTSYHIKWQIHFFDMVVDRWWCRPFTLNRMPTKYVSFSLRTSQEEGTGDKSPFPIGQRGSEKEKETNNEDSLHRTESVI